MTINELVEEYGLNRSGFERFIVKNHIRIKWNFLGTDGDLPEDTNIEALVAEYKRILAGEEKARKNKEALLENIEQSKVQYALSESGNYEYDVVEMIDKTGKTDILELQRILDEHANNGWRLVNSFTNELGKNVLAIMGLGINSTVDQVILIFERRVRIN